MLQYLATTSVLGWLTNARLVREIHGSVSQFCVIKILHQVKMFIDNIGEFK